MDKNAIVSTIIGILEEELEKATVAAHESADEATDEESRPENKYDTRGLETSYLASAQAHYAKDLKSALQAYHNLTLPDPKSLSTVCLGTLVTTLSENGRDLFFVGPAHGGVEIPFEAGTITVITPQSPIGKAIVGKKMGDHVSSSIRYTILRIE